MIFHMQNFGAIFCWSWLITMPNPFICGKLWFSKQLLMMRPLFLWTKHFGYCAKPLQIEAVLLVKQSSMMKYTWQQVMLLYVVLLNYKLLIHIFSWSRNFVSRNIVHALLTIASHHSFHSFPHFPLATSFALIRSISLFIFLCAWYLLYAYCIWRQ